MTSFIKTIVTTVVIIVAGLLIIEAVRLLMLKHDIEAYKQYWEQRNSQSADPDSILYVALGDSTAQGIGASKPTKGYVGLLAAHITKTSGHSVHTINLSSTGAKINDVITEQLPRLQHMQLPTGTIVTIEIGANDLGNFESEKFNSQMQELIQQLPPQTIIADMPYFGGGRSKGREVEAVKASAIIHNLAMTYGLRVAPLHDITKQGDSLWDYGADFFHPNDRGYINWYKAFASILDQ